MRCAVILAPPGQGKSLLTQMTARARAHEAWTALKAQQRDIADLPLPIVVPLNVLAEAMLHERGTPEELLRLALTTALQRECSKVAAVYLAAHAHEARCWLFL